MIFEDRFIRPYDRYDFDFYKSQINILETKQLKYWKKKNGSKCHNTCQASLFGNILQSAETLNGAFDSDN